MPSKDRGSGIDEIGLEAEGQDFDFIKKGSSHILSSPGGETSKLKVIGLASAIVFGLILIFLMFGSSGNRAEDKMAKEIEELKGKVSELEDMRLKVQRLEKAMEEIQKTNSELTQNIFNIRKELNLLAQQRQHPNQQALAQIREQAKEEPKKTPSKVSKEQLPKVHVVQKGESLHSIAKKYKVDYQELLKLNNIKDPNKVLVGQTLKLSP